jgi:SAM-dependent methyltransferase
VKRAVAEQLGSDAIWHDVECGAYTADLRLWRELRDDVRRSTGACAVLELGCGTGRVSLDLAGDGCHVTALDLDEELVAVVGQRARDRDLPIEPVVGDARSFSLGQRFDLVLAPMQLVQLLRSEGERAALLRCVGDHLKADGWAAFALLDVAEHWEASPGAAPVPDVREIDGWVYSSQPVAVRHIERGRAVELDRVRRAVSPEGRLSESFSRMRLLLLSQLKLEREAARAGLAAEPSRRVPATRDHVGSTVVLTSRAKGRGA